MANIKTIKGDVIRRILSAKFYFFKYITEKPNEFYNMYPLVFSLGKVNKNLFQGIDFHYIAPKQRIVLLEDLRNITPSLVKSPVRFAAEFRKLMVKVRKYKLAKVAFKRYNIDSIIAGKIIRIKPEDWDQAILEPVERFINYQGNKISSKKIWKETLIEGLT